MTVLTFMTRVLLPLTASFEVLTAHEVPYSVKPYYPLGMLSPSPLQSKIWVALRDISRLESLQSGSLARGKHREKLSLYLKCY